jgi:transposase-like protein
MTPVQIVCHPIFDPSDELKVVWWLGLRVWMIWSRAVTLTESVFLSLRWYLRLRLSYRDVVEITAERGLSLVHTTIMRWVHHYAPEFEGRWNRFARSGGSSWRVDETFVKMRGKWRYLYRAVDGVGRTVDFHLIGMRDVGAAKAFYRRAIESQGLLHGPPHWAVTRHLIARCAKRRPTASCRRMQRCTLRSICTT